MASCTVQWPLTFLGTKLEVLSSLMDWSLFFVVVACFFVCLFFGKGVLDPSVPNVLASHPLGAFFTGH